MNRNENFTGNKNSDFNLMKKSAMPSFMQHNVQIEQNFSPRIDHNDISSSIKNSIENYEKNLIKLSASLRNMRDLKTN